MTTYKYGMAGAGVRELQAQLNKLGHRLSIDGKYGANTSRAVSDFQEENGLVIDGIAGPATQDMLTRRIYENTGEKLHEALDAIAKLREVKELEKWLN